MASSGFGDDLFAEFDREPEPSDKLLRQKIEHDEQVAPLSHLVEEADDEDEDQDDWNERKSGGESEAESETQPFEVEQSVATMLSIIRNETNSSKENGNCDVAAAQKSLLDEYKTITKESILFAKNDYGNKN